MGKELFDNIPSKVEGLLREVELGKIGLPDLQRPFVWSDSKVRDLLDSMLKGYPVGYIMLWSSPDEYGNVKHIGDNEKVYKEPDDLVIDGQQRLTALLAALHGTKVRDKNYNTGSTESEVEKQFADLRDVTTAEGFVAYLETAIETRLTDDFFTYGLPSSLESSSANSLSWFGYVASLVVLGTPCCSALRRFPSTSPLERAGRRTPSTSTTFPQRAT